MFLLMVKKKKKKILPEPPVDCLIVPPGVHASHLGNHCSVAC